MAPDDVDASPANDYAVAIRRDAVAAFELCAANPGMEIPACPGWRSEDLRDYLVQMFRRPFHAPDVLGDVDTNTAAAVDDALTYIDRDRLHGRAVAHECAIHRWDVETATGADHALDAELATTAIDEFFVEAWPKYLRAYQRVAGTGETLHLHRTDGDGEWLVTLDDLPRVEHVHADADVALRGTVSDLALWTWGRIDPPNAAGDRAVLASIANPNGRHVSPGF